jgi:hypothetical protein
MTDSAQAAIELKAREPAILALLEVAKFATVAVSLREAGFTTEAIRWPRDPLAVKLLCAWNNVPPDKAPPGWAYHPSDKSFEAWERVATAARIELTPAADPGGEDARAAAEEYAYNPDSPVVRTHNNSWIDPEAAFLAGAAWQKALATPSQGEAIGADVEALRAKLRMIVSHATGGSSQDIDAYTNDICVRITENVNRIYAHGQEAALSTARETASGGEVVQADRDAAANFARDGQARSIRDRLAYREGKKDDDLLVQSFRDHRLTHSRPDGEVRDAAFREAAAELASRVEGFKEAARKQGKKVGGLAAGFSEAARIILALQSADGEGGR